MKKSIKNTTDTTDKAPSSKRIPFPVEQPRILTGEGWKRRRRAEFKNAGSKRKAA